MTVHRPSAPQGNRCLISPFLASLGAQEQSDIALILHLNVVINWQLSKQGIRWPVSPGRFAGSGFDPSSSSIFWSYPLKSYLFSNDRRFKFNFLKNSYEKKGGLCAALLKFWFHSDLRSEIQPAVTAREDSCLWLFSPWSSFGHALRPIFITIIIQEFV